MDSNENKKNQEAYVDAFAADRYLQDTVKLAHTINLSNVSEKGTVFEIDKDQGDLHYLNQEDDDPFYDEELIKSLSLGAGNGIFDDDDDESSSDDGEPFEKIAKKMEDVSGDGGVLKMEVNPGVGSDLPKGALVTFHYSSYLEYSDEPFDSTYLRNRPERKRLDGEDILPGLNIALKTMRKNETARFLVKPQYAYGKIGCLPRIPGNETIFYEITILSYVDALAADSYEDQGYDQKRATFKERLEGARGFHRKGNDLYREGNLLGAKNAYTRAAWIMEDANLKNEEEEEQRGSVLVKVRSNLAQVFLDLKEPAQACTQCKKGLSVTKVHSEELISKLYYRFGKAKMMLSDFTGALSEFKKAQRLRPHNTDISAAMEDLLIKKSKYETVEKFFYRRMFQDNGKEKNQEQETDTSSDHNQNKLKVRPEFEQVVEKQILDFAADPKIKELAFPGNLSQAELACVAAAAKAAGFMVTVKQRGLECFLKVTKE